MLKKLILSKERIIILVSVFLFIGCVTPPIKVGYLDKNYYEKQINSICVLPIIDERKDKSYKVDFTDKILQQIQKTIETKGYNVEAANNFSEAKRVTIPEILEMTSEELSQLGPSSAQTILFIYLEDVASRYLVMSYTFKMELRAVLIDKKDGTILWRDKGVGSAGQGGLISGVVGPMLKTGVINSCINNMFVSLPQSRM